MLKFGAAYLLLLLSPGLASAVPTLTQIVNGKNFYERLGVSPGATKVELKAAFTKIRMAYQIQLDQGASDVVEAMQLAGQAWSALKSIPETPSVNALIANLSIRIDDSKVRDWTNDIPGLFPTYFDFKSRESVKSLFYQIFVSQPDFFLYFLLLFDPKDQDVGLLEFQKHLKAIGKTYLNQEGRGLPADITFYEGVEKILHSVIGDNDHTGIVDNPYAFARIVRLMFDLEFFPVQFQLIILKVAVNTPHNGEEFLVRLIPHASDELLVAMSRMLISHPKFARGSLWIIRNFPKTISSAVEKEWIRMMDANVDEGSGRIANELLNRQAGGEKPLKYVLDTFRSIPRDQLKGLYQKLSASVLLVKYKHHYGEALSYLKWLLETGGVNPNFDMVWEIPDKFSKFEAALPSDLGDDIAIKVSQRSHEEQKRHKQKFSTTCEIFLSKKMEPQSH